MTATLEQPHQECKEDGHFPPEWVTDLPPDKAALKESWPPQANSIDWDQPTFEVYSDPNFRDFTPPFKGARRKLDYGYHRNPAKSRQELQDVILSRVVRAVEESITSPSSSEEEEKTPDRRPWIIFSAGSMGVGKGYVLSTLHERGIFPLDQLLHIDPDKLKAELPEMAGYLQQDVATAATKVHRESTQMADVLLEHALQARLPTLVDGSLRDVDFYRSLMKRIRSEFPEYQLAILHVTASPEIIRQRAAKRAELTGRAVPPDLLEGSIKQVPKSVEALAPFVDITYTIANQDNQPIQLTKMRIKGKEVLNDQNVVTWRHFRDAWLSNLEDIIPKEGKKCTLKLKMSWCQTQCPGLSQMSICWKNQKCITSFKKCHQKAYPSSCPTCALGADMQCGTCIHGAHWCQCPECGPGSTKKKDACKKSDCSLTKMFQKKLA